MKFLLIMLGILFTVIIISVHTSYVSGAGSPFICPSLGISSQDAHDVEANANFILEKNPNDPDAQSKLDQSRLCIHEIREIGYSILNQVDQYRNPTSDDDRCPEAGGYAKDDAQYNLDLNDRRNSKLDTFEGQGLDLSEISYFRGKELSLKSTFMNCLAYFVKKEKDEQTAQNVVHQFGINETDIKEKLGGDEQLNDLYNKNCLIATAAYGSALAPEVQMLREIRDHKLLSTSSGTSFMTLFNKYYYTFSPTVAGWENQNPVFREMVKFTITPLITSLSILKYTDMDSEAKVLTFGIGIILLNIGIYFVGPAFAVVKLRNHFRK